MPTITTETQTLIIQVLDDLKRQHSLATNGALARFLKVPDIYISRWYNGEYGKSAFRYLAPRLVDYGRRAQEVAP